ncbi:hypothetical protein [Deinococcus hopiensis]|uniref:Uncharacterized protein n=1 Tax=Deinococcus hopiensis KR-140 TaxID=695939 RepID=A0A1W1UXM2_9DEIO|nr:hypothetical protein [Deinococcus hopiensis]SMB85847.1 hypothetical protein SAMN00790413_03565 [Deinococcus hopiensis KR-140]
MTWAEILECIRSIWPGLSRPARRLPPAVLLTVRLRPLVTLELIGATSVSVRLSHEPLPRVTGHLYTEAPEAILTPLTWDRLL